MGRRYAEGSSPFSKRYISYEVRVLLMGLFVVIMFLVAGVFIFKSLNSRDVKNVSCDEAGEISYQVCSKSNSDECSNEKAEYLTDDAGKVRSNFAYKAEYSDRVSYKYSYYVTGKLKIYEPDYPSEVLYSVDDVLVERTKVEGYYDKVNLSVEVDIPYDEYNSYVLQYKNKFSLDVVADLEVSLYVDDMQAEKSVATLTLPFGEDTFSIEKKVLSYNNLEMVVDDSSYDGINVIYASISALFALFGLLILVRLVGLIVKSINNDSKYQRRLKQILRDYDRIIVMARDGYSLNDSIRVIKVTSFSELKDARDTLERPIVYVRVNNVKSEFYVEDGDKVYLYVMKEADFQ